MALEHEGNTDLAFDTTVLREYGARYGEIAKELTTMATKLDTCIENLKNSGWTTPAGTAFYEMTQTNWKDNIEKYAHLLNTLQLILSQSADSYDRLVTDYIEETKV